MNVKKLGSLVRFLEVPSVKKNGNTYYSYNRPKIGSRDGVNWNRKLKKNQNVFAIIHSHAAWSANPEHSNDFFSGGDELIAEGYHFEYRVGKLTNMYVATPEGNLFFYNPQTPAKINMEYKVPIFRDLPYDKNHPNKK